LTTAATALVLEANALVRTARKEVVIENLLLLIMYRLWILKHYLWNLLWQARMAMAVAQPLEDQQSSPDVYSKHDAKSQSSTC
jgi:hypothetical protein